MDETDRVRAARLSLDIEAFASPGAEPLTGDESMEEIATKTASLRSRFKEYVTTEGPGVFDPLVRYMTTDPEPIPRPSASAGVRARFARALVKAANRIAPKED